VYSKPISFQIGNAPRTISDVNNPSYQDLDLQIAKNTQIGDRYRLQLRLEMFNAFNHPVLAGPNMGITSGQFGVISSYANSQRRIQLAAKINF
jgi:preprotein translocase subunit SecB